MDMLPLCVVCSAPSYQSSRSIIGRPILVGDISTHFLCRTLLRDAPRCFETKMHLISFTAMQNGSIDSKLPRLFPKTVALAAVMILYKNRKRSQYL